MNKCECKKGRCFLDETKQGDSTYACDENCYLTYSDHAESYKKRFKKEFNDIVNQNKDE